MAKHKGFFVAILASFALAGLTAGAAFAASDNGQAIGQEPLKLALTQCSNAGIGNGGEDIEGVGSTRVGALFASTECIEGKLGHALTADEYSMLLDTYNCEKFLIFFACEVDPGNSSGHNQAGQ